MSGLWWLGRRVGDWTWLARGHVRGRAWCVSLGGLSVSDRQLMTLVEPGTRRRRRRRRRRRYYCCQWLVHWRRHATLLSLSLVCWQSLPSCHRDRETFRTTPLMSIRTIRTPGDGGWRLRTGFTSAAPQFFPFYVSSLSIISVSCMLSVVLVVSFFLSFMLIVCRSFVSCVLGLVAWIKKRLIDWLIDWLVDWL